MKDVTLCLVLDEDRLLLGRKKRGFGSDKFNGFGGKLEDGEDLEEAARRELYEETGGHLGEEYGVRAGSLSYVGRINYIFPDKPNWNQRMHIYLVNKFSGVPKETEEMTVEWFGLSDLPYDRMWENDRTWLQLVLEGKKVEGTVRHDNDGKTIEQDIYTIENLD